MCDIPENTIPSDSDTVVGTAFKLKLNRLDVKLTVGSDLIPSSLIIQGISLLKEISDRGGAFSDVYEAQCADGTKVAVKKLRTTLNANDTRAYSRVGGTSFEFWKDVQNYIIFSGILSRSFHLEASQASKCPTIPGRELRIIPSIVVLGLLVGRERSYHEIHQQPGIRRG